MKENSIFSKLKYEIMFSIILLANILYYLPTMREISSWTIMPYALSYRLGFISRGFIGSILRLAFPMLTYKEIYIYIFINILLLCALCVAMMHMILVRSMDEHRDGIIFLLFLFLANPGAISFLFYWGNYGRFDMFLVMNLFITAMIIISGRGLLAIPVLASFAMLVHQGYTFQYYPAVLAMLFYCGFVQKKKYAKASFGVTLVVPCILFLVLQFFAKINYTYEETLEMIDLTTDLPGVFFTQDMMIKIEYYTGVFKTFVVFVKEPFARNVIKTLPYFLFLLPMIKIITDIWKSFCKAHKSILVKFIPWFVLIAQLPLYVLTCDYGRDYSALVICNFVMIFVLYCIDAKGIRDGVNELAIKVNNNKAYYAFVLVLCVSLGKFGAAEIGDLGNRIYTVAMSIFE